MINSENIRKLNKRISKAEAADRAVQFYDKTIEKMENNPSPQYDVKEDYMWRLFHWLDRGRQARKAGKLIITQE